MNTQLGLSVAFLAGLASFLSPCVLPLVPIYLAQLVGQSVQQSTQASRAFSARLTTFLHAATFVLGFTLAFVALGATASALGGLLAEYRSLLYKIGGIILIVLGLHVTGIFRIPLLSQPKKWNFQPTRPGYPASLLSGMIFALAWSPCIGPILGSIMALAASAATLQQGVGLLLIYALGLGLPFLLLGLGLNQVSSFLKWLRPHLGKIQIATGILLIIMGVLVFNNLFAYLNSYFSIGLQLA